MTPNGPFVRLRKPSCVVSCPTLGSVCGSASGPNVSLIPGGTFVILRASDIYARPLKMTRYMLMRQGDAEPKLIGETALPLERDLHDVLTLHPQLLPAEDLGLGRTVVAGRESSLTSGYADLVLVDDRGQLCLVEVKKEGNPDTRQVVAQLLDYAAALWGQPLSQFEQSVVGPYLATLPAEDKPENLLALLTAALDDPETGEERAQLAVDRLHQTLESGDFTLVLAAPQIPARVQRVLEYLNARGQRFYALEVSYFREGRAECFVPRLVVMPLASSGIGGGSAEPIDPIAFLDQLPAHVRPAVEAFLAAAASAGARVIWQSYGASIKVTREKTRQVAYLESKRLGATIQASGGFPAEPAAEVARRLKELGVGEPKSWWHMAQWSEMTSEQVLEALNIVLDGIIALVPQLAWSPIDPPRTVTFERNDHNMWVNRLLPIADLQGSRLRGELRRVAPPATAAVELLPLGAASPGWRPIFPQGAPDGLWPPGVYQGEYELVVREEAQQAPPSSATPAASGSGESGAR